MTGSYGPDWINDHADPAGFVLLACWMQHAGELRDERAVYGLVAGVADRSPESVRVQVEHVVSLVAWAEWFETDPRTALDEWNAANQTATPLDDAAALQAQLRADAVVTAQQLTTVQAQPRLQAVS